jgi:hypothetical protein
MVVDTTHGRVFLTGGGSDGVVVRNLAGGPVTTITNEPGAAGMALSADRTLLYVALSGGDAVSAIDTTLLTEVARYATGAASCPSTLAVASGKVWFGYENCDTRLSNVGSIDPTTVPATVSKGLWGSDSSSGTPRLESSAAKPELLVLWRTGYPGTLQVGDVSTGDLVLGASRALSGGAALSEDGVHIPTAQSGQAPQHSFSSADLSQDGTFATNVTFPGVLATGPSGAVAGFVQPTVVLASAAFLMT